MENNKSLISLMLKKERVHWMRTLDILPLMDDIGSKFISFPILVVIVSIFHYCFAIMHFLFECYMYLTNRNRFNKNMEVSHKRTDKKLAELKSTRVTKINLKPVTV